MARALQTTDPRTAPPHGISRPADAFRLFDHRLAGRAREHVVAAYLSPEGCLLGLVEIGEGDATAVTLPIAAILRDALLRGAAMVILAHNHPAGDPSPSIEDLRATRRFATAADAIGLRLLDHIVVANGGCLSLRVMGLL